MNQLWVISIVGHFPFLRENFAFLQDFRWFWLLKGLGPQFTRQARFLFIEQKFILQKAHSTCAFVAELGQVRIGEGWGWGDIRGKTSQRMRCGLQVKPLPCRFLGRFRVSTAVWKATQRASQHTLSPWGIATVANLFHSYYISEMNLLG